MFTDFWNIVRTYQTDTNFLIITIDQFLYSLSIGDIKITFLKSRRYQNYFKCSKINCCNRRNICLWPPKPKNQKDLEYLKLLIKNSTTKILFSNLLMNSRLKKFHADPPIAIISSSQSILVLFQLKHLEKLSANHWTASIKFWACHRSLTQSTKKYILVHKKEVADFLRIVSVNFD